MVEGKERGKYTHTSKNYKKSIETKGEEGKKESKRKSIGKTN